MKKFFFSRVFKKQDTFESIEDIPSEGEVVEGDIETQENEETPRRTEATTSADTPSTHTDSRATKGLMTIHLNPLGRPPSNIYQSVESPDYDTFSEESKDVGESTEYKSKSNFKAETNNNSEELESSNEVEKHKRQGFAVFSIEEEETSDNCVIKCFCMKKCK